MEFFGKKWAVIVCLSAALAGALVVLYFVKPFFTPFAMSDDRSNYVLLPPAVDVQLPAHLVAAGEPRARVAAERVRGELEAELAQKGLHWGDPVWIRVFKEEAELEVHVRDRASGKFRLFRVYRIAQHSGVLGPKLREGDRQVPEGFYEAGRASMRPDSNFHLAVNCGYPNAYDLAHQRTGSFIMIHGQRVSSGCLAMSDARVEEIYSLCDAALTAGQARFGIHIFPFRMRQERMAAAVNHAHYGFWQNLKEGYDWFERQQIPPACAVKNLRYVFR